MADGVGNGESSPNVLTGRYRVRSIMRTALEWVLIVGECMQDSWLHLRDSAVPDGGFTGRESDPVKLECQLTKDYHRVEKGLALRSPKRPFGAAVGARLQWGLAGAAPEVEERIGDSVKTALAALQDWNDSGRRSADIAPLGLAGAGLPSAPSGLFRELAQSRRSVRDFDPDVEVPEATVLAAVETSLLTPSVCNRQPWQVYILRDPDVRARALALQNGNAGFRDAIPVVAVVTVDRRLFSGAGERNQRWVDGGLFAMSLVWALQDEGLSTCMLNWSVRRRQTRRLRDVVGFGSFEDVVVMMAIGYARAGHRVARSPRRSIAEVARVE